MSSIQSMMSDITPHDNGVNIGFPLFDRRMKKSIVSGVIAAIYARYGSRLPTPTVGVTPSLISIQSGKIAGVQAINSYFSETALDFTNSMVHIPFANRTSLGSDMYGSMGVFLLSVIEDVIMKFMGSGIPITKMLKTAVMRAAIEMTARYTSNSLF